MCAAILAGVYFGFSTWRYVTHNYRLAQEESRIKDDLGRLDREHIQLVAVRDYLQSDEYIEHVARSVLGLVRPGETLVVVSSSAPPVPASATPTPGTAAGAEPWWRDLFVEPAAAPTPGVTSPIAP
jgi:cell division protein FtsB